MTSSYAVANVILALFTSIAALVFLFQKKDENLKASQRRKVRIAKGIALTIAIVSCLICIFSEDAMAPELEWADRWTVVLIIMFGGELMADYFVNKKCHYNEENE